MINHRWIQRAVALVVMSYAMLALASPSGAFFSVCPSKIAFNVADTKMDYSSFSELSPSITLSGFRAVPLPSQGVFESVTQGGNLLREGRYYHAMFYGARVINQTPICSYRVSLAPQADVIVSVSSSQSGLAPATWQGECMGAAHQCAFE